MSEICLDSPGEALIPLSWMKNYLKVDHDADDSLINQLMISAQLMIENYAGISFTQKKWQHTHNQESGRSRQANPWKDARYSGPFSLRISPVVAIVSVTSQTITDDWVCEGWKTRTNGYKTEVYIPRQHIMQAMRIIIKYTAGYARIEEVPTLYKDAICMLVQRYYQRRESPDPALGHMAGLPSDICTFLHISQARGWLS
ncbi:MAG: phage gp6-like head-tail connector protein [Alphaproteobacteria bacterium]|nr:MAG: phage gp6-like head-tail connector protein [Alphaproteobacteria bacterium]